MDTRMVVGIAVVATRIAPIVIVEITAVSATDAEVVMIIDRITPTQIRIVSTSIKNRTVIEIEVGVPIPRAPAIGRPIVLDHTHFWRTTIS